MSSERVHPIDQSNFLHHIQNNPRTVVKFGAAWCGPCKALAPLLDRSAQEFPDVSFVEVDIESAPNLAAQYRIRALPTVMAWKDGTVLWTKVGVPTPNDLRTAVAQLTD